MRYSIGSDEYRSKLTSPFDSTTLNYVTYQISSHSVHKQGHHGNIFNFWHIWKKVWGRVTPLSGALKPPVRQLRNGFSNSAQNLDSETIFIPFKGWLKVSYLFDYMVLKIFSVGWVMMMSSFELI